MDLIGPHDEVLAEYRDGNRGANRVQIGQRTVEATLLGQNADDPRATTLIRAGKLCGVGDVG
jgi:hypothetical protein